MAHRSGGIVRVVPALPPPVHGLGNYEAILAQELANVGVISRFVVAGMPPATSICFRAGLSAVQVVREQKAAALIEALELANADTVLLHFVGYGYAQ